MPVRATMFGCVVVGNPANTNAMVAAAHAPDIPSNRFTALTRLDHNRAVAAMARHAEVPVTEISRMTIWGNHSPTQYPDIFHAIVGGRSGADYAADTHWLTDDFIPTVARRGTAIIEARGSSSAASAANGAIDHIDDWVHGTPEGDWTSVALPSPGVYGVDEGLVCSFPCRSVGGQWQIVDGLDINEFSRSPHRRLGGRTALPSATPWPHWACCRPATGGARRYRRRRPDHHTRRRRSSRPRRNRGAPVAGSVARSSGQCSRG